MKSNFCCLVVFDFLLSHPELVKHTYVCVKGIQTEFVSRLAVREYCNYLVNFFLNESSLKIRRHYQITSISKNEEN